MVESKNRLNRQKQALEKEINERALKLKTMGKTIPAGFEPLLEHKALTQLLVRKGIITKDELIVTYLEELKAMLDQIIAAETTALKRLHIIKAGA